MLGPMPFRVTYADAHTTTFSSIQYAQGGNQ